MQHLRIKYRLIGLPIILALLGLTLGACEKTDELPIEPPRPSTVDAQPADKAVNLDIAPGSTHEKRIVKVSDSIAQFNGFGPARFGNDEAALRKSWPKPLNATQTAKGASCYYLYEDTESAPHAVRFMLENQRFVRYDVLNASHAAPGNIAIGDSAEAIQEVYADQKVKSQPHKYVEGGHTYTVAAPEPDHTKLVFETDKNNIITQWHVGVVPQVDYVEGCS